VCIGLLQLLLGGVLLFFCMQTIMQALKKQNVTV
jgi:hypothetical protein